MCKQFLPTSTIRNIWRTVRRICMLTLGLKGLKKLVFSVPLFKERSFYPSSDSLLVRNSHLQRKPYFFSLKRFDSTQFSYKL